MSNEKLVAGQMIEDKIPWLSPYNTDFPPVSSAIKEPNGLLAIGGDLSEKRLIEAYRRGIFPWYEEGQPILWWSPDPRAVLIPKDLKISTSLKKVLNKQTYTVTFDAAFEAVITACAGPRQGTKGTWITPEMIDAYIRLHKAGVAHSVESWLGGKLAGGLYGINLGRIFFGESMFSHQDNASKVAFVHLVKQLEKWQFPIIDCQVSNPHLMSLGTTKIPLAQFCQYLDRYVDLPEPESWCLDWNFDKH